MSCVVVDGHVAWVGTLDGYLVGLDLDAPGGPAGLGRIPLGALPVSAAVAGTGRVALALQGTDTGDLAIIDTTQPGAPVLLSRAGLGVPTYGIAIDGSLALAATELGLATVDLSDPAHPVPLAMQRMPATDPYRWVNFPMASFSVALHQGIAWVGSVWAVFGFDVRVPAHPRLVARAGTGGNVFALAFDGARTFAMGALLFGRGMLELDTSQPRNVLTVKEAEPALQK